MTSSRCPAPATSPDDMVWRLLGLKTQPVSNDFVSSVSPKLRGGLYIQAVSPGSPAALAAIQKGDILVGMNVGSTALGNDPARQHPLRAAAARNHSNPERHSLPGPPQRHSAPAHQPCRHDGPIDSEPVRLARSRRRRPRRRGCRWPFRLHSPLMIASRSSTLNGRKAIDISRITR